MGGAIKSEIRKVFTTRLWWGMLIGLVIIGGGLSAIYAAQVGTMGSGQGGDAILDRPSARAAQLVYSAGFATLSLAALFPLALGVILITSEFRHKTWTSTVLATPKRWPITIAKVAAIVAVGFVYALVYIVASVAGGGLVLSLAKNSGLYLTDGNVLQTLALLLLAFIIWMLLGFGFGLLVRNQIAAVFIAVGLAFIGNIVFQIIFELLKWHSAAKFLPANLTDGMLNPDLHSIAPDRVFSWWVCALIFTGYGVLITVVGSVLNQRKDVL